MEYVAPFFRGGKARALVPLCIAFYLHNFIDQLLTVPTIRLVEDAICRRYYGGPADEPGLGCNTGAVQKRLVFILGWYYYVECLPGIATAIIWGHVGDRNGRRLALAVSCVGRLLALLGVLAIGIWHDTLPTELILLTPLLKFIGGGSRVFTSIVLTVASDATQSFERTKLFFFIALLMDVANFTAPPVAAWALDRSLWLPFQVAVVLLAAVLVVVWIIPDTRHHRNPPEPVAAALGAEAEPLLGDHAPEADEPPREDAGDGGHPPPPRRTDLSWKSLLRRLRDLASDRGVLILLLCSFFKQTAFFSRSFFAPYAAATYRLTSEMTAWITGLQAAGVILALAVILPAAAGILQRRLRSPRAVALTISRAALIVLVCAYASAWVSWTVPLLAAAVFFCGAGEGAEPAIYALASSLVVPAQYSLLFAAITVLESTGRIIGSVIMTALLRVGWNGEGRLTGLVFGVPAIEAVASEIVEIDLTDEQTVVNAAEEFGPHRPLEMLINVAGLGPDVEHWYEHNAELIKGRFETNAVGAFLTMKHFHPNLLRTAGNVINVSSNAGDNITIVSMNPGYVPTRMTNYRSRDNIDECIAGIVKVIESLDISKTGSFLDWRGKTLPW